MSNATQQKQQFLVNAQDKIKNGEKIEKAVLSKQNTDQDTAIAHTSDVY
jgi:hypothetical protein